MPNASVREEEVEDDEEDERMPGVGGAARSENEGDSDEWAGH
jgi:hypothetical protein